MEKKTNSSAAEIPQAKALKNIPVTLAVLQAATMLPGGITESTLSPTKIHGIEMLWVRNEGLLVKIKGHEAFIPDTNVKIAYFKAE